MPWHKRAEVVSCLGSLFSRAVGREEHCRQMSLACVGALAVFRPHWVCPRSLVCAFPIYTVQAPGCSIATGPWVACGSSFRVLHKSADSTGPAFCAFPTREAQAARSLRSALSLGAVCLLPSAVPASSFCMRRSGAPCVCSGELVSSCDPPTRCQPSRISGSLWLEIGSMFTVW